MRDGLRWQPLIIAMLAGCSASSAQKQSLCDLRLNADREKLAGQMLSVTGELLVSKHGSAVIDPKCDGGIPIKWFENDVPKMREFDAAAQRLQALQPVIVTVRVTGKMSKAAKSEFLNEPYWYLDLESAEVLNQKSSDS